MATTNTNYSSWENQPSLSLTDQTLIILEQAAKDVKTAVTNYLSNSANDINLLLNITEQALATYKNSLDPFVSATGNTLTGKFGFVFNNQQLVSTIAKIRDEGASNPLVRDLIQNISGVLASAGLMIQASAEIQVAAGATGVVEKMVFVGSRINNYALGVTVTAGIASYIADQPVPSGSFSTDGFWNILDYQNGVKHAVDTRYPANSIVPTIGYNDVWAITNGDIVSLVEKNTSTGDIRYSTINTAIGVDDDYFSALNNMFNPLSVTTITQMSNGLSRVTTTNNAGTNTYLDIMATGQRLTDLATLYNMPVSEIALSNPNITDINARNYSVSIYIPVETNGNSVYLSSNPLSTLSTDPTTSTIAINTKTTSAATSNGATNVGQAAADVAVGYALATGSYSVAFTHGELNSNVYFNVVVGAAATGGIRAGNFNLSVNTTIGPDGNITPYSNLLGATASTPINQYGVPTGIFNGQVTYAPNFAVNNNVSSTQQNNLTYVDPLILDLNGDGIQLTSFADRTVLFDIDHDALGSKEQTGWVKMNTTTPATGATGANAIRMDGILVHDLNGNGKIDGINETLSQYYNGTIGSNGTDGQQKYSNGFTALKSLDSNADNKFTAADAAYSSLRVWVDSNADGISDAGELKTLTELSITAINLNATAQSGLINGGNEVLASGSFTQTINGLTQTRTAQAVDFIANPAGSTFTVDATGVRINTEVADGGQATTAYAYTGTDNANLNTATLNVNNLYGNTGNDTLTGDANANWLGGGAGGATNDSEWRMQA